MQEESGGRQRFQFTLGWLVIFFIIVSSGLGLGIIAFKRHRTSASLTSTQAKLHWLRVTLDHYRVECGAFPGFNPSSNGLDLGTNLNVPCVVYGSKASKEPIRENLKAFVLSWHRLAGDYSGKPEELAIDAWGHPIVLRFLRVPEKQPDGTLKVVERSYLWSYGPDGVNGVDATPDYANRGAPDYDKEEAARIERSFENCGDDITWSDGRMAIDR